MLLDKQRYERQLDKLLLKRRIALLQWDRDRMNDLLGDLSPYYGERTLFEIFRLENKKGKKNDTLSSCDDDDEDDEHNEVLVHQEKVEEWINV